MNKDFHLVAPVYTTFESLAYGEALSVARLAFIEIVLKAPRVLLIGEGNGRFLAACLANKTGGSVTVIDSSARMLQLLQRRISNIEVETRLDLVHVDFFDWDAKSAPFDVVVTHFFLDLFRPFTQRRRDFFLDFLPGQYRLIRRDGIRSSTFAIGLTCSTRWPGARKSRSW